MCNFLTREEAAAEKAALEIRAHQVAAGYRPVLTKLTESQAREAESVFGRVAGKAQSLTFYVDFALENYTPPETAKRLKAGILDYLAARKRELDQDQLSQPQYGKIYWELKRLEKRFKDIVIAEITSTALTEYLEADKPTMKTHNNRRGVLSHFFKYAFQRARTSEATRIISACIGYVYGARSIRILRQSPDPHGRFFGGCCIRLY